ncbi:Filament-like plant protein [Sesbania bispinosa]|nr:Filament-like plant protein [Sesbania bispinosa]
MDRRWPWKKKSSDKVVLEKAAAELDCWCFGQGNQERSNMLIKLSEEKAHAEAEIEHHKSNIESCEREINSLKYELHVISKELEIRNEEKNMSMRSAEAANKQHMEGVKKIAKLEAECQRLRGLVRKKLPGPAALAQMKLEVENLGRDYGETRLRKSPVKPAEGISKIHHPYKPRKHVQSKCKHAPSMISMSEDGNDDVVEKLARLSNDSNGDTTNEVVTNDVSEVSTSKDDPQSERKSDSDQLPSEVPSAAVFSAANSRSDIDGLSSAELRSRILSVFESMDKDADIGKILKDIKHVLEDARHFYPGLCNPLPVMSTF